MPYPFDQIFAADPDNTEMVASNVSVLIFAPGDATKAPLPLTTLNGLPLANPVPVNDKGFGPAFIAELDQVAWEGGGYTGLLPSYKGMKDEAVAARLAADESRAIAEEAARNAVVPTGDALRHALVNDDTARGAVEAIAQGVSVEAVKQVGNSADPLAYLNNIEVLASWDTRPSDGNLPWAFPQAVNIDPVAEEIYVASQDGTLLRIDVRNMDGTLKSYKTITTTSGAYTEGLPYWRTSGGELCFMVRTGTGSTENTYNIYNYTRGTIGPQTPINGLWKAATQGQFLVTTDARNFTINQVYLYDFDSVKAGAPRLLHTIQIQRYDISTVEKNQGIVINDGYVFVLQGAGGATPAITVYNFAGQLVNTFQYERSEVASAINALIPGMGLGSTFDYENEGGCTVGGQLVSMHVVNPTPGNWPTSKTVLLRHNVSTGLKMSATPTLYSHDTGWVNLRLLNEVERYASDTTPRVRRIGNQVYIEGAIKGATATNIDVAEIPQEFRPRFNRQYTQIFGSGGQSSSWQVTVNSGTLKFLGVTTGPVTATSWLPLSSNWLRG